MTQRPPTVLFITPFFSPNLGGVETRFDDITSYLDRNGYRVRVLTYQPIVTRHTRGASHEKRGHDTEIWRMSWPAGDLFHRLLDSPLLCVPYLASGLLVRAFIFLCRHGKDVDVIHAPGLNAALVARILHFFFRIPFVVTIHALYEFESNSPSGRWTKWILSGSRRILALSETSRQNILSLGLDQSLVGIHTNWIDIRRFSPMDKDACKDRLGLRGKFVVLMVGRLKKIKGVDLVLALARTLRRPDIMVVVAGEGDMAEEVVSEGASNPNLLYLGRVENSDLPATYGAADISIVPSTYAEGFSRVVLESLCCGIPLVASSLGCIPEEVNESCCILIQPTVENLTKAVLDLHGHPERLRSMSYAAREYGASRYSENNMSSILDAYGIGVRGTGASNVEHRTVGLDHRPTTRDT